MAGSSARTFVLSEKDGITLELRERALPHWPMSISGKQRAEFTWYPGSPQAVVQMLGPEEGTINLKGFWKDKFIQGSGAARKYSTTYSKNIQSGALTAPEIPDVATLVSIVDNMRRMGREITLQWGDIWRRGHITEFTQSWQTPHYCEWELEFTVSALEESNIPAQPNTATNFGDAATQAQGWVSTKENLKFLNANLPYELTPLESIRAAINDLDNGIIGFSNQITGAMQQVASYAMLPGEATKSIMTACQGAITSTVAATRNIADSALTSVFSVGAAVSTVVGLGETAFHEDGLAVGVQMAGMSYLRQLRSAWTQITESATYLRQNAQLQLQDDLIIAFTAKQNMDLRDVSTQFYGTPDQWRNLMAYNGLTESRLTAGQLIWVPRNPTSTGAGNTYGGGP